MQELLEKAQDNSLSDFQKLTLQQMKNTSKRSKVIVFGDCVSQFERMVDSHKRLYESMPAFSQQKFNQNSSVWNSSK